MHELVCAARTLRKTPEFSAIAILTIALGVGANTAIFSVVKAVLINQLPYRDPGRLVAIASASHDTPRPITVDFTTTHDWRERSRSFESLPLYRFASAAFVEGGRPEVIAGLRVNYDFFDTLGVQMLLGRAFLPEEDRSDRRYEVILTHGLWMRRFGGDPHVLGRVVHLSDASFTIVGVLPLGFEDLLVQQDTQIFMPLGYDLGQRDSCRGCQHLRLIGRLKRGVTVAHASAELNTIMAGIAREHPDSYPPDISVRVPPLRDYLFGRVSAALWILLAAVALVLLIACVNVANLLLARASGRAKELALRAALGAGRMRLIRQLLSESLRNPARKRDSCRLGGARRERSTQTRTRRDGVADALHRIVQIDARGAQRGHESEQNAGEQTRGQAKRSGDSIAARSIFRTGSSPMTTPMRPSPTSIRSRPIISA